MWIGCCGKVLPTPRVLDSALLGLLTEDPFLLVSSNMLDGNAKDLNLHNLERIRRIFPKPSLPQMMARCVCCA